MRRVIAALLLAAAPASAGGTAGEFDYYVMALSWSPNWCAREGAAGGSAQCAAEPGLGWILHGLWPQHERGWPDWCETRAAPPGPGETAAMAGIMGTASLAAYQWRKHGVCSGLDPAGYFALSRAAHDSVRQPEALGRLERPVRLPAADVEAAFLEANPALHADAITVTCRDGYVQEARICLTRDLEFRSCGAGLRDCTLDDALFLPAK